MEEIYGIIYKYTFDNNKCYIGQSTNLKSRISYYRNHHKKSKYPFLRALNKYGFDDSKFIIIDTATNKDDLNILEIKYIKEYDSTKKGYNLSLGGGGSSGYLHTNDYKKHMSVLYTGENNPFFGKKHTKETLEKISKSSKARTPIWLGKKHTEEYKINMSKNHPKSQEIICCETG